MENQQKTNYKNQKLSNLKRTYRIRLQIELTHYQKDGRLNLPANYSVGNAITSAWLILQNTFDKEKRPVLTSCTKESVANALLDMAIMGLNPAKKARLIYRIRKPIVLVYILFWQMCSA